MQVEHFRGSEHRIRGADENLYAPGTRRIDNREPVRCPVSPFQGLLSSLGSPRVALHQEADPISSPDLSTEAGQLHRLPLGDGSPDMSYNGRWPIQVERSALSMEDK